MKLKVYKIAAALACFTMLSCEKHFLDINDDPSNPLDVSLELLLPSVQLDMAGSLGTSTAGLSQITSTYMHQIVQRSNQNDYGVQGTDGGVQSPWLILYTRALADNESIIKKATEQEAWPYLGIAQAMKAYSYSLMVDVWGDVPYSEAHKSPEILLPKYDKGEDIYPQLFQLLDDAKANLQKESIFEVGNEDLFYGGDTDLWIKFVNSVKLKLYNQVRHVQDVSAEVDALIAEDNFISSAAEDFEMEYGTSVGPDNRNPGYVQEWAPGTANYYISPYFYEIMANLNTFDHPDYGGKIGVRDPRIPYYFYNQIGEVSAASSPENPCTYCYGYVDPNSGDFVIKEPALQGTGMVSIFAFSLDIDPNEGYGQGRSQTVVGLYPVGGKYDDGEGGASNFDGYPQTPQRLLNYYAVKFIEAELFLTGAATGDARLALRDGIRAAFAKVNEIADGVGAPVISTTARDAYVNAVLTAYDAADDAGKLEHIMTQKWIASFGWGVDMYTDYRRTGYPQLYDGNTDNLSFTIRTKDYPFAFPWPTNNLAVNSNAPAQKVVTSNDAKPFWME
ncbi:MAG TPA: SusD/RagB family nutrient-binding outer membrane lipoprotein [Ohtaekwangia sp.]|uniref:SusD/RagB family nutrient-binding outer membrane lipoprotein n=1 Tax=Ohtaekwangia sp. TaxID=2066019 RepID=UPI002F95704E